ncbi:MAG: hypothetical protein ACRDFX_00465 [Chloroflexota bacterium]
MLGNFAPDCQNTENPCFGASPVTVLQVTTTADGPADAANCPGPQCSLRDAVTKASSVSQTPGEQFVIRLRSGQYNLTQGELTLTTNIISIVGTGAATTTVTNSSGNSRIFDIVTNATLEGMTISGGVNGVGAGILDGGMLALLGTNLSGNHAYDGGGLSPTGDAQPLSITSSTFSSNTAVSDGGGLAIEGGQAVTTLNQVTFRGNTANYGGGLFNAANLAITGGTFQSNQAASNGSSRGGGIYTFDSGFTTVEGGAFTSNSSDFSGGGTYNDGNQTWIGTTFSHNTATQDGGGMSARNSRFHNSSLSSLTFTGNTAGTSGVQGTAGGLYLDNPGTVMNTSFQQNTVLGPGTSPGRGGGDFSNDENTFALDSFTGNTAGDGAGLYDGDFSGDFSPIVYSTFTANHATHDGGGFYEGDPDRPLIADILLSHTSVTGNRADHDGGGIYETAYPLVYVTDGSVVSNNVAENACNDISPC